MMSSRKRMLLTLAGGIFLFLALVFYATHINGATTIREDLPFRGEVELRSFESAKVVVVIQAEDYDKMPPSAIFTDTTGITGTSEIEWLSPHVETGAMYARIKVKENTSEVSINTPLFPVVYFLAKSWQVLPSNRGWGRAWTQLTGIEVTRPATVTIGSVITIDLIVENASKLTGSNMPVLVTYATRLKRISAFPLLFGISLFLKKIIMKI